MIHPNFHAREQERLALQRENEEREEKERETRERASRRLAHFVFEEMDTSGSEEVGPQGLGSKEDPTAQAETGTISSPVSSADAGAHGMEPETGASPAEQLAGILFHGEGVPVEPWR